MNGNSARRSGALVIACAGAVVLCQGAVAKPSPPIGKVTSVSVDPSTVLPGSDVAVAVGVANSKDVRSAPARRQLLLKLRAPDGRTGVVVARERIPGLGAGKTTALALTVQVPPDAAAGSSTLIACRVHREKPDSCGISRVTTPLVVQAPREEPTPADLSIAPGPQSFGTHATGTSSEARTFTVTNAGRSASGVITTSIGGTDASQFTKSADSCNSQTLAPGASCTIDVAFAPASIGAKSGSLAVDATPGGASAAALSGTGLMPANLVISPTSKNFPVVQEGGPPSAPQTFSITNVGGVSSGQISTSLAGAESGDFSKSNDTCDGYTLAAGASCSVDVAFAPGAEGHKTASVQVSASPGGTASAALTGDSTSTDPALLSARPPSIAFPNTLAGTTSAPETVIVENAGGATIVSVRFPFGADPYVISDDECSGRLLANGATCAFKVSFAPTVPVLRDYVYAIDIAPSDVSPHAVVIVRGRSTF